MSKESEYYRSSRAGRDSGRAAFDYRSREVELCGIYDFGVVVRSLVIPRDLRVVIYICELDENKQP